MKPISAMILRAYATVAYAWADFAEWYLRRACDAWREDGARPSHPAFAYIRCAEAYARLPPVRDRSSEVLERIRAMTRTALSFDGEINNGAGEDYWRSMASLYRRAALLTRKCAVCPADLDEAHRYLAKAKHASRQCRAPGMQYAIKQTEREWQKRDRVALFA